MKLPHLLLALAALAASTLPMLGQGSFDSVTLVNGGTNYVAGSTTITAGTASGGVSVARTDPVGLLVSFTPVATNVTGQVVFTFAKGLSDSEVETAGSVTVTVATQTNAAPSRAFAEVDVGGVAYLKLVSIANGCSVAVTNVTVKAIRKSPAVLSLTR
ncbi:MAG: hypothetical protein LDL56_04335 [Armatimonadetes bacterium]|nr:hypothetical protein [Armatimonadota bacterium]